MNDRQLQFRHQFFTTILLLTPLSGIMLGIFTAFWNGIPITSFATNVAALFVGMIVVLFLAPRWRAALDRNILPVSILAFTIIASTMFFPGISGVHRWIQVGGLALNASAIFLPLLIYAIQKCRSVQAILLITSVLLVLLWQPDAGQASAFGCAAMIIFLLNKQLRLLTRIIVTLLIIMGVMITWCRQDPLPAVPQVEEILILAVKSGYIFAVVALAVVIILMLPLIYVLLQQWIINKKPDALTLAFLGYLTTSFLVTYLGNFPVPVIGAGASSVLGWFLMTVLMKN